MISADFLTAGKAIFTVKMPNGAHYTYKVTKHEASGKTFVALLTGPDNGRDYTYLGVMEANGYVRTTAKSKYKPDTLPIRIVDRVCQRIIAGESEAITNAGFAVYHVGRCGRCGRTLTVPSSIETGLGPECAGKV